MQGALREAVEGSVRVGMEEMGRKLREELKAQVEEGVKAAVQEAVRACFVEMVVPAVERSCGAMLQQMEVAMGAGLKHVSASLHQQHRIDSSSNAALATSLQEAIAEARALASTLGAVEGQMKLLCDSLSLSTSASASAAEKIKTSLLRGNPSSSSHSNGLLTLHETEKEKQVLSLEHVEAALDPTRELTRLVAENNLEGAFTRALSLSDTAIVSWLCSQLRPEVVLEGGPGGQAGLSQGVLLSLVSQLAADISHDTALKLRWLKPAVMVVNPADPQLGLHMKPILQQLYHKLHSHLQSVQSSIANPSPTPASVSSASLAGIASELRLVLHVVNSILTTCK